MVDRRPAETGEGLRRRFRYARIEAAVADATSAILIGGTGVATVLTLTAEGRGMLNPGTWLWVLVSGGLVTAGKIALDIRDMRRAGAVWRKLLIQSFGEDMRGDKWPGCVARHGSRRGWRRVPGRGLPRSRSG